MKVVIDEVQRRPDLFPILRVLLDRKPLPAKFMILGSASPDLLRQSSESLAGRMEMIEMDGFGLSEVGQSHASRLWLRGGFPLSFLAKNDVDSFAWRKSFIQAFLERDLHQQGIDIPAVAMHRFWTMLAHSHGQIWNAAPFAIEEVIHSVAPDDLYYWATHSGAEIDLVLFKEGRMYGLEVKRADAPVMTSSMRVALEDLKLERIFVIYPGNKRYSLHKKIDVVPFETIHGMKGLF